MNLSKFLNPKSIAVIGASNDTKKLGYQILQNIKANKFKGKIFPINLKEKKIQGLKSYTDINLVKSVIDLAVIVIPAQVVIGEIKKCAELGIKNIVIISSGFGETTDEGKAREAEIKKLAVDFDLNILGPNCLGFINTEISLNATFARVSSNVGSTAFISQSGAICSAVLDWAKDKNIGFSKFVSLGNKAVLDENDFFRDLISDNKTSLVIAYLEEITDGQEFMNIVSTLAKTKTVAILKAGQTSAGAQAAMSHTGSMTGSNEATLAGLKRAGAIVLKNIEELFNLISISQRPVEYKNSDIYIISNAGGPIVLSADRVSKLGLSLGKFSPNIIKSLKRNLPSIASPHNPLDIIGDANSQRYKFAMEDVLRDDSVANLLVLLTPQTSTETEKTATAIGELANKYKHKLICTSFMGGRSLDESVKILEKNRIFNFPFPNQAINIIGKLNNQKQANKNLKIFKYKKSTLMTKQGIQMDYLKSLALLNQYNIPTLETIKISRPDDLLKLNYPLVLKVVGEKLIHKTDKKAIALNLKDVKQASLAFAKFTPLLLDPGNYCISQPMAKNKLEIILGFKRDKSFGPIMIVGLGGIYTEAFNDIISEVGDVDIKRAKQMIDQLRISKILNGARGVEFAKGALIKAIVDLAKLAKEHEEISELDINPLFIDSTGVVASDVRIII